MNLTKITVLAAATSVAAWAAKTVTIAQAGGLGRSAFEGPFYFAGLLACLSAIVLLAVSLTRGRGVLVATGAAVAGVVGMFVVAILVNVVIDALVASDSWVWGEVNLWVLALAVLALALWRDNVAAAPAHRLSAQSHEASSAR